ncbi:acyl-CoA dehydrogenase [Streptomyces sp. NPDC012623]|uniref:acyl-CoA dehydrogenase n=1 Tax=unclassified Streptomyces TaxID=2593676 RepID=UPI00367FEA0A
MTRAVEPAAVPGTDGKRLGEVPLPGSGGTAERFRVLYELGREDLCVARLAEGHLDAVAVLDEIAGLGIGPGERWGVWAAQPPGAVLSARRTGERWLLDGVKPYCSGAHSCTHALVTADTVTGRRIFAVSLDQDGVRAVPGTWRAVGMAGSDTPDVAFTGAGAMPVGGVDAYTDRPGFEHGGIGVAACWLGGARGAAEPLYVAARERPDDTLTSAHLGAVDTLLSTAETVLVRAAEDIDADPSDALGGARKRTLRVRALIELVCTDVLRHVGRATGAGPLCHDPRQARAVADLTVYVRQHHAERDLAELGRLAAAEPASGISASARGDRDGTAGSGAR